MKVSQLLCVLQNTDPDKVVRYGFDSAHPYCIDPYGAAFMPCENTTVGAMLWAVRQVLENPEDGCQLDAGSICYIAEKDKLGEEIGKYYLAYAIDVDPVVIEVLVE